MLERSQQKNILKFCKENNIIARKLDSSSQRGFPDLVVIPPSGRVLFVELKTATGKLSKLQEYTHKQLRQNNAEVFVCRSLDEFKQILTTEKG